jgi:hypothetical protein
MRSSKPVCRTGRLLVSQVYSVALSDNISLRNFKFRRTGGLVRIWFVPKFTLRSQVCEPDNNQSRTNPEQNPCLFAKKRPIAPFRA